MKAKKHWNRRVLSFLLALAMVVTQLGVWNVGKESVQAAVGSLKHVHDFFGVLPIQIARWLISQQQSRAVD